MSVAEQFHNNAGNDPGHGALTKELADWIAAVGPGDITPAAETWGKHAILDWFGVTIAGASEPLVDILMDEYAGEAVGGCTIVARGAKTIASHAALINGSSSHALDYDDVNRRLHGHPTVTVAPVVLALGEQLGASGKSVLDAFIVGTEAGCLIGSMAGNGHYAAGFHATGTIGTFGAAAAAAKLMGLNGEQTRYALGIAASQAAGLKSNFGTMTKPLHAGKAAMNGLMAARLAARGFTSNDEIIEGPQGIADVMMPGFVGGPATPNPDGYYSVEQTLFKYHAACYLTHASIEAINALRAEHGIGLDDLKSMTLYGNPGHATVCNIPNPSTGLEVKFSIRHCAAMALDGADTSALETFSDANANKAKYDYARDKITFAPVDSMHSMEGRVSIELDDGRTFEKFYDASIPAQDLGEQEKKLSGKFNSLSTPVIGAERTEAIANQVMSLESANSIAALMETAR
ncbi:MAG: MmgE/PrpD family protein [Pseudomonadota bacterium]